MVLQSILQVYTTHITAAEFLKELFYFICSKETIPHHRWWAALTSPAWRMWILFLPPDWLSTDRQTDRWRNLLMIISFEWFVSREGRGCLSQATEVISERQKFFFFLHTKKTAGVFSCYLPHLHSVKHAFTFQFFYVCYFSFGDQKGSNNSSSHLTHSRLTRVLTAVVWQVLESESETRLLPRFYTEKEFAFV